MGDPLYPGNWRISLCPAITSFVALSYAILQAQIEHGTVIVSFPAPITATIDLLHADELVGLIVATGKLDEVAL